MDRAASLITWSFRGSIAALVGRPALRSAAFSFALLLSSLLVACDTRSSTSAPQTDDVPASSSGPGIVILPAEVAIDEGGSSQLRVFQRMADGGAGRELPSTTPLTWHTTDGSVAPVEGGLVQATRLGSARITVSTKDGQTATSDVRVVRQVARVEILAGANQMGSVGATLDGQIVARLVSKLGRPVEGADVGFAVVSGGGSTAVRDATTGPDGVVRTQWTLGPVMGEQALEVRVTDNADVASRVLGTARAGAVTNMSVQPSQIGLIPGNSLQIEVVAQDAYGNRIDPSTVSWSSADPSIASVSSTGVVSGLRDGSTQIFANIDVPAGVAGAGGPALATQSIGGRANVIVGSTADLSFSVDGDNQTGLVGVRLGRTLKLKFTNGSGKAVSQVGVSWVITSGGGTPSATQTKTSGTGLTEIYWTLGGVAGGQTLEARIAGREPIRFSATALVGPVAKIELRPATGQISTGGTLQFQAIVTDKFGNVKTVTPTWAVGDGTVATVTNGGVANGRKAGRTQVRATVEALSSAAQLDVLEGITNTTNAPPSANFTVACTNLTCNFTDTSLDTDGLVTARKWTFGDGGTLNSTATTVTRTFAIAGTYTVTLQVTDDKGATGSVSKPVTVSSSTTTGPNNPPVASYTYQCQDLSCSFVDTSTDQNGQVTGRVWNFGDGGTSTETNPTRTYASAGTYTVTLTVSDAQGATGTKSQQVTVSAPSSPVSEWNKTLQDTLITGNLVIPGGQKWLIGRNVRVAGNVLVQDAVLGMRPGSTLKIEGANPNAYVGGGLQYSAALDSDRGVWVWGNGQLDIACTPKSGWNRTGADPSWLSTDEYWIAPTELYDFKARRWTPGQPIPRVSSRVPAAEVINVSRDCKIEGPGHIHIHSQRAQRIEYVQLRGLGVSNVASGGPVLGRYALHLHLSGDGTRGTVIRGVAAIDSKGTVFVPHASHGVTMIDNVSVNSYGSVLWWDIAHETNDLLVDHMAAVGIAAGEEVTGGKQVNPEAFLLGAGRNMEIRNSVAAGTFGGKLAVGFNWPEPTSAFDQNGPMVWKFDTGNVAHNNVGAGVRFWNNNGNPHVVANYQSYRNGNGAIEQGAYKNGNEYRNIVSVEDGYVINGDRSGNITGLAWNSNGMFNEEGRPSSVKNAWISSLEGPALIVGHRQLDSQTPVLFEDCTLVPAPGQPRVYIEATAFNPWKARFVRCGVTPDDFVFENYAGGNEGTEILIDHEDGRKWTVTVEGGRKVVRTR